MKTSVDIPDEELEEAMRLTGAKTKKEAIVIAISEFNRRRRLESVAAKFGTLKGFPSAQEVQRQRKSSK